MKRARECAEGRGERRVSRDTAFLRCCASGPADYVILLKRLLDNQGPCLLQTAVALYCVFDTYGFAHISFLPYTKQLQTGISTFKHTFN